MQLAALATACALAALTGLSGAQQSKQPRWLVAALDSAQVTRQLTLSKKEVDVSDNGRTRVRWTIRGLDKLEVIGNNQSDADLVAWHCSSYDKAGNSLSLVPPDSYCGKFLTSVLKNVVSSPEIVTGLLLQHNTHKTRDDVYWRSGDFSIERDGQYFSIRRLSRIK